MFVIARRLAYNDGTMMATASSDRRALQAKVRVVQRLLIKAYGEPPRPAWAGTVGPLNRAQASTQWNPIDPLDELINTILSQNTNDLNRDRAYHALRAQFPTWEAVRDAAPSQVVAAIKSAGLANQKGPRIQKVLRRITQERGELDLDFLRNLATDEAKAWLMSLNGVGPKTASI